MQDVGERSNEVNGEESVRGARFSTSRKSAKPRVRSIPPRDWTFGLTSGAVFELKRRVRFVRFLEAGYCSDIDLFRLLRRTEATRERTTRGKLARRS